MTDWNRRTARRLATAMLAMGLVAGCSGGDDSAAPEPSPTPVAYTAAQLEAAMPAEDDLPLDAKVDFVCPGDDEICDSIEGPAAFAVGAKVDAASPVGAEQIQSAPNPVDFIAVNSNLYGSAAELEAVQAKARQDQEVFEGDFDLAEGESAGGTSPRLRGTGRLEDISVGQWTGYVSSRSIVAGDSENDPGLLVAVVTLGSDRAFVTGFASLSAADRDPGAAEDVAESLVRDYLERLG